MFIFDTREQKNQHIKATFKARGIPFRIQKLDVGDYMLEGNPTVSIDRKQDLEELSRNLTNRQDHARFMREVRRAHEAHIHLIILCEHGNGITGPRDLLGWRSEWTGVSGRDLQDAIFRVSVSYGVDFVFCSPEETAKIIYKKLQKKY